MTEKSKNLIINYINNTIKKAIQNLNGFFVLQYFLSFINR